MLSRITLFITCFSILFLFSCQENVPEDLKKVNDQKAAYQANPSKETAAGYVAAVSLYNTMHAGEDGVKELLEDAYVVASKEGQDVVAAGISNEMIKNYPADPKNKERIYSLSNSMKKMGKQDAGLALSYFLSKKYPDFAAEKGIVLPDNMPATPDEYIKIKAEKIFEDADVGGLNRSASFRYVDAAEAYVMVYPETEEASRYLFNAAEISKTIGTFKKSLSLYDWIINKYPNNEKAPTALFLKAFILEDNLNNIDAARETYEMFIKKYPDHHFADDAQFSLDNLGKTDEEIQAELERLQKLNN